VLTSGWAPLPSIGAPPHPKDPWSGPRNTSRTSYIRTVALGSRQPLRLSYMLRTLRKNPLRRNRGNPPDFEPQGGKSIIINCFRQCFTFYPVELEHASDYTLPTRRNPIPARLRGRCRLNPILAPIAWLIDLTALDFIWDRKSANGTPGGPPFHDPRR